MKKQRNYKIEVYSRKTVFDNLYIFEVMNKKPFGRDEGTIRTMEDWCNENFSESDKYVIAYLSDENPRWNRVGTTFYFSSEEWATLFKLTWVGHDE